MRGWRWGYRGSASTRDSSVSPVGAAPLARHLVSPTVLLSLGSREGEGDCGRRRRPSRNRSQTPIGRQRLPLQSHIWPRHADVGGQRVPPREAPQVLSMPSRTPKAPEASFWTSRIRFSAFSRKLERVGKEWSRAWGSAPGSPGYVPSCPAGWGAGPVREPRDLAARLGTSWSDAAPPPLPGGLCLCWADTQPGGCGWPALARWGHTVSWWESAVLSQTDERERAGHLYTALMGTVFLEGTGREEKEGPKQFLSLAFSFFLSSSCLFVFAKVILGRDFTF